MQEFIRLRIFQSLDENMPEAYYRFVERIFQEAWADYEKAGRPFGDSDRGLTIWYEFGQTARRN